MCRQEATMAATLYKLFSRATFRYADVDEVIDR